MPDAIRVQVRDRLEDRLRPVVLARVNGLAEERLVRHLPARATVTGAGFTTPYVSNRPDAFNLTISGATGAEYMFIPSEAADFIGDERSTVTRLLKSGEYGVVAIEPPFALAKKGYSTSRNDEMMGRW